jgi:hypothetical protein
MSSLRKSKKSSDGTVFACEYCEQPFASAGSRHNHYQLRHRQHFPYQCDTCNYACNKDTQLDAHRRFKHAGLLAIAY